MCGRYKKLSCTNIVRKNILRFLIYRYKKHLHSWIDSRCVKTGSGCGFLIYDFQDPESAENSWIESATLPSWLNKMVGKWCSTIWICVGEGEGSKDVSDQIDNEDMLDGATDGKEKPQEDKNDVPEEDNGIEMSEDFDSHLQVSSWRIKMCYLCFLHRFIIHARIINGLTLICKNYPPTDPEQ